MHLRQRVAASLSTFFALSWLTSSAPAQSAFSNLPDGGSDLFIAPPQTFNISIGPDGAQRINASDSRTGFVPPSTNISTEVDYTWPIFGTTLSLNISIGPWELAPEKIVQTLEAAQTAVGKKQAGALLEKKFKQETGSRINTMIFEISPGYIYRRLTWADVGEVLGDNGLPRFFQEMEEWHSAYFKVIDSVRGELGNGAVRKWYMLDPVGGTNSTGLENE